MEFSIRTEQPLQILFFLHALLSIITIRLEYVLFYQFYTKITTFSSIKKCSVWLLPYTLTSKSLAETDVKMKSRHQKWRLNVKFVTLTSCTRNVLHPSFKMTFPSPGRIHGNSGRVCKKKAFLHTGPEFPWSRPGLGNAVLNGWSKTTLLHDVRMTSWRFDLILRLEVMLTSFSAKRFDVNVLDRNRT